MTENPQTKGGEQNAERVDLRADLLSLLRERGTRTMSEALFREATEGNKSGSVIRAYELVREIVGGGGDSGGIREPVLSGLTDGQLRELLAELEGGDGDG